MACVTQGGPVSAWPTAAGTDVSPPRRVVDGTVPGMASSSCDGFPALLTTPVSTVVGNYDTVARPVVQASRKRVRHAVSADEVGVPRRRVCGFNVAGPGERVSRLCPFPLNRLHMMCIAALFLSLRLRRVLRVFRLGRLQVITMLVRRIVQRQRRCLSPARQRTRW